MMFYALYTEQHALYTPTRYCNYTSIRYRVMSVYV